MSVPVWACVLLPVIAALAIYLPAARNGFVWDDPLVFQQLEHFHSVGDLLVPPDAVPRFYYRPLIFLSFMVDRALGGPGPWMFHATVIAWHLLATALVFWLSIRLLGTRHRIEAALAALVFALHPLHVESVAWIAGRSDVAAAIFVIVAVLFGSQVTTSWTAWVAGVAVLLGCWAKEVALAAVVLIPARDFCIDGKLYPSRYVPIATGVTAYFVSRYIGIGSVGGGLENAADTAQLLRDVVAAVGWYGCKLLVPIGLNAYIPQVPTDPGYALLGVATIAFVAGVGVWSWMRGWRVLTFALIWWLATTAPSLMVIVRRSASAVLAERYAYLPSIGLVLAIGWLLTRIRPLAAWRVAAGFVVAASCVCAVASRQRIGVWADNLSFWSDVASKVPGESLPHRELADALMTQNRLDEAETHYRAALSAHSDREGLVMVYNNLGNLYIRRERFDDAEAAYRKGIELYPHPRLYSGLGRTAIERARRASESDAARQLLIAQDALTRAVAGDPQDYRSHNLLGQVLFNLGKGAEAKEQFEASLRIQPTGSIADIARKYLQQIGS